MNDVAVSAPPLSILLVNQRWLREELQRLGHRVVTAGWSDGDFDVTLRGTGGRIEELLAKLPSGFVPDALVYFDSSSPLGLFGLEDCPVPTLFYSVDAHHHASWHSRIGAVLDAVLLAQRDFLPTYRVLQPNTEWFPLWAPMQAVPEQVKTYDAVFRGTLDPKLHPVRAQFFAELKKHVAVDVGQGGYIEVYRQAKIVINQAVKDDMNFRIFEALMCGAMLITPRVDNGVLDLFRDGEDLVTYEPGNVEEAARKIQYFLKHEAERQRIAHQGWTKVNELHTREKRAEQLAERIRQLDITKRRKDYTSAGLAYLSSSTMCRKSATVAGHLLLFEAQRAFSSACTAHEAITPELVNGIAITKFLLEMEGYVERVPLLTEQAWRAYPEDSTLLVLHLDTLLQQSRECAQTFLAGLSPGLEEMLDNVRPCVDDWRGELQARIAAANAA